MLNEMREMASKLNNVNPHSKTPLKHKLRNYKANK